MVLQAGTVFGNYRIVRLIGEGGFGEVYLAENPLIDRRAAIKILHPSMATDAEMLRRFLNEARAASAIRHPNIIEVFDAGGAADGAPYILMEFLEGASLKARLAEVGTIPLPRALDIANQASSALAAAHAAGIVHRDLKPENLFLVPSADAAGGELVKILDFGIAKIRHKDQADGTLRTQSGLILGSPTYMSPEQCKDSADVDLRSDIYSFAIILYEMLAGRPPHVAATGTELLVLHLTQDPPPLRELAPDVPGHIEAAIMHALAREREDRFQRVGDLLDALNGRGTGIARMTTRRFAGKPPAQAAATAGPADPTIARAGTTLSQLTGDVDAALGEAVQAGGHAWRWLALAVTGVVVTGAALFFVLRPRPADYPRATPAGAGAPASALVSPRPPPLAGTPVALPTVPDASPLPTAAVELPKPEHAANQPAINHPDDARGKRRTRVSRRPVNASPHGTGPKPPSAKPGEENVAGF